MAEGILVTVESCEARLLLVPTRLHSTVKNRTTDGASSFCGVQLLVNLLAKFRIE
jgi:hypothetical protein